MADVSIKHLSCCGVTRCHASTQEFKIFWSGQMPWFAALEAECCSMGLHNLSTIEHMQMSVLWCTTCKAKLFSYQGNECQNMCHIICQIKSQNTRQNNMEHMWQKLLPQQMEENMPKWDSECMSDEIGQISDFRSASLPHQMSESMPKWMPDCWSKHISEFVSGLVSEYISVRKYSLSIVQEFTV